MAEWTLEQLERMLPLRQRKLVAYVIDGYSQTEAAVRAGYSPKTAAGQASETLKKPKVAAYRRALTCAVLENLCLTPESIAVRLFEIYGRCMQKKPVMEWDYEQREWVESGFWQFDARGAVKVLELLGKNMGMFTDRVQVSGSLETVEGYIRGIEQGEIG